MPDPLPHDLTIPSPDVPLDDNAPKIDIPAFIGVYEIRGLIGYGGMGRVFLAIDPSLDREVAIKTLADELTHLPLPRQRFLREARTAASVKHENVVTVHAVSEESGRPYLVMEFVRGESLQERLDRDGPLPLRELVRIGAEIAAGLAAAHQQEVVHRDIKPANVLIERDSGRTKLSDFGLARAADDISMSMSGVIVGTPSYMAPEQARGEPIDSRADLFSFGCTLFAMITGKPPFEATSPLLIIRRICEDKTPALEQIRKDAPEWLCAITERLLAKHPNDRYQTAREVAELLRQIHLHLDPSLNAPLPFVPSRKPRHSRTTPIVIGGLITVMLVGWLIFALMSGVGQLPLPNQEMKNAK